MVGDVINIKPAYFATAAMLLEDINKRGLPERHPKLVVIIGGESGSGKSVTGICLGRLFEEAGLPVQVLHMDDYYRLPPKDNHERRVAGIEWVGPQEVRLDLLEQHLHAFIDGAAELMKPLSDYAQNIITEETIRLDEARVLIVEGTYTLLLKNGHYRIFMERNYHDTHAQRVERGRDVIDEFVEKVLAIEHSIVTVSGKTADAIVKKDYSVQIV